MQVESTVTDEAILKAIGYCGIAVAIVGTLIGIVANTVA